MGHADRLGKTPKTKKRRLLRRFLSHPMSGILIIKHWEKLLDHCLDVNSIQLRENQLMGPYLFINSSMLDDDVLHDLGRKSTPKEIKKALTTVTEAYTYQYPFTLFPYDPSDDEAQILWPFVEIIEKDLL